MDVNMDKMQRQVLWKGYASNIYHGRNGYGTAIGVEVWDLNGDRPTVQKPEDQIFLQPITKKTKESTPACTIQIPRESLREVAKAVLGEDLLLDKVLSSKAIEDRLPLLMGLDPTLDTLIEPRLKHG